MALLSERKEGRSDGGYTRLFGISELGALISQVHATSISAGTELEKLICTTHTNTMTAEMLTKFLNKNLANGTYLIPKDIIKKYIKVMIGSKSEPDFIIIVIVDAKAYVVEIKDGDTFDTKKSAGEIKSCREFAMQLSSFLMQKGLAYDVSIRICCFNQDSIDEIVKGFKSQIKKSEAWTGKDLCKVLGISHANILTRRAVNQKDNLKFFLDKLVSIPEVKKQVVAMLNPPIVLPLPVVSPLPIV